MQRSNPPNRQTVKHDTLNKAPEEREAEGE